MYEIKVFGVYFDNIESIGGWQSVLKTNNQGYAFHIYDEYCEKLGTENVALYNDDELVEFYVFDDDDPYEDDDSDGWDDGSDVSCGDCPDDECTGHCFSCAYRSF